MKYTLLLLICCLTSQLAAQKWQTESDFFPAGNYREIGLNMTPLLTMLIPFNRSNPKITGPYMMKFHRYKNNKFFRSSIGVDLADAFNDDEENAHFNVRFGWGKRRLMHDRFALLTSFDITVSVGDLNILGTKDQDGAKFAVGPTWGMEYGLNDKMNIGIETALLIGVGVGFNTGFVFEFVPPVAIYLNVRVPEKSGRGRARNRP